ncbi:MAG: Tm-1-like ATP-binding domain-containing protein, partial [Anaerolineae bacterium]
YEMVAFHANGIGGMAMEDLVEQGLLVGVLDFATHEFADHLYNGYCGNIGPGRLEAAGKVGIPQVVVPGGLDCIVLEFDSPESIPNQFKGRKIFWYDFRSGVRTSAEELTMLAETIAGKLNKARGPVKVVIPANGWSEADCEGAPLYEPETNQVFVEELSRLLRSDIPIVEIDAHINEPGFAEAAVLALDELMHAHRFHEKDKHSQGTRKESLDR